MNQHNELIEKDILAYLKEHERKELLRFITCGSVDDGKSTLIGRLLHDAQSIFDDQLAAITRDSKRLGTNEGELDLALLVDGLQSEREQGITIDVAYRYFSTDKRKFIIADTPGHEQYTRNMATGASTAEAAVILVDARHGVQVQTRRHAHIVALLGIRQVVFAINKMDLVEYEQAVFDAIAKDCRALSQELGLNDIALVPLSALAGDNVVSSSDAMPWYSGGTLLQWLESVPVGQAARHQAARFPVQWVNRPNGHFRGYAGTLASGRLQMGDEVLALPSGRRSRIAEIVSFDGPQSSAGAGAAVTLTLEDELDLSRGEMLVHPEHPPHQASHLELTLIWMADEPLVPGREYAVKLGAQNVYGRVREVKDKLVINSGERVAAETLGLNEIGTVVLETTATVLFDAYRENRQTGALVLIDRISNLTLGAGMILRPKAASANAPAQFSEFELELNALVRKHFPHWQARDLRELMAAQDGASPDKET